MVKQLINKLKESVNDLRVLSTILTLVGILILVTATGLWIL
jgi:uncharacterized membrane protein